MGSRRPGRLRRARWQAPATATFPSHESPDTDIECLRYRDNPTIYETSSKLESPHQRDGIPALPTGNHKRDASLAGLDSSPGSIESPEQHNGHNDLSARKKAVKRACNECRELHSTPLFD